MAKDYAPNKRKKRKAPVKKVKRSWSRILLTLLVTVGLVAGFFYIAQQPVDEAAQASTKKSTTPTAPTPAPKQKPKLEAPKIKVQAQKEPPSRQSKDNSDFAFYDMLPESEIKAPEVEAYKSNPKDPNKNITQRIQTGSFRDERDAQSQRARLILIGIENITIEKTNSAENGTWYRVRLGAFKTRSQLNKAIDVLVHNNFDYLKIN